MNQDPGAAGGSAGAVGARLSSLLLLVVVCSSLQPSSATPVVFPTGLNPSLPPISRREFCYLPEEFGLNPEITFLEDCKSLERFTTVPFVLPGYGVHPMVCCPPRLDSESICFPTDAWCSTYENPFKDLLASLPQVEASLPQEAASQPQEAASLPQETPATEEQLDLRDVNNEALANLQVEGQSEVEYEEAPTMASKSCAATYNCTIISRCPSLEGVENWPANGPVCGFDPAASQLMVCCPESSILPAPADPVPPRFPTKNGKARSCEDRHQLCGQWRDQGACDLDHHFSLSEMDPGNGYVESAHMFQFMAAACPATCGWCGNKGCADEHTRCPIFAQLGACSGAYSLFMVHSCRESCGICGFLSPFNIEIQKSANGDSFTDLVAKDFHCGLTKPIAEINGLSATSPDAKPSAKQDLEEEDAVTNIVEDSGDGGALDLRTVERSRRATEEDPAAEDDQGLFFYFTSANATDNEIFCSGTVISDRWILSAAHCYDNFGGQQGKVRVNTIRANTNYMEVIETKRVYKHPLYKYGEAYNDVSLIELGRRIVYNYDKFGDTPTCLDLGLEVVNKIATVQGFGLTEDGTKGKLLEGNVTIISNEECQINLNEALKNGAKTKINRAMKYGVQYGMLCAMDKDPIKRGNETVYRGSCNGDSGGPLFITDDKKRNTLVGIVSGGVDCKAGYPSWYTKVVFFRSWIKCIMQGSLQGLKTDLEIEEDCKLSIEKEPEEPKPLFDLRG